MEDRSPGVQAPLQGSAGNCHHVEARPTQAASLTLWASTTCLWRAGLHPSLVHTALFGNSLQRVRGIAGKKSDAKDFLLLKEKETWPNLGQSWKGEDFSP